MAHASGPRSGERLHDMNDAGDTDEQARAAVSQAVDAIRANPLVFLQVEAKRLESALMERLQPVVTEDVFID